MFQVIKVDTKTGETKTWCKPNCYPSEPIFVPAPNAKVRQYVALCINNIFMRTYKIFVFIIIINKPLHIIAQF